MMPLIALVLAAQIDTSACVGATPACRQAAGSAILIERAKAETASAHLDRCEDKLAARTSTVIERLVPVPSDSEAAEDDNGTLIIIALIVGAAGLAFGGGVLAGIQVSR